MLEQINQKNWKGGFSFQKIMTAAVMVKNWKGGWCIVFFILQQSKWKLEKIIISSPKVLSRLQATIKSSNNELREINL